MLFFLLLFAWFRLFFSRKGLSMYSWLVWNCYVNQADLELKHIYLTLPPVLGLKQCATTPASTFYKVKDDLEYLILMPSPP